MFRPALYAVVLGGLYVAYLVLLYCLQSSIIYPGAGSRTRPPLQPDRTAREVIWLQTSIGRVEAWYLAPRVASSGANPGLPAVIVGHGNAELIDTMPGGFLGFRDRGYAVLLVEYPGFGDSEGTPSLASVTEIFTVAYDSLVSRPEIDAQRILALGRSLGGGAVCALAAQRPLAGLVLVATFADLPGLAHRYLAPSFLVRDRYDNVGVLRTFAGPVFVAHGTEDGLIPHRHGEALAAAAPRARLRSYAAGHDDCPSDWDAFWRDVDTFLVEEGLRPSSDGAYR